MSTSFLLASSFKEFTAICQELGLEAFRAKQVWEWIFVKGVFSFDKMTNLSLAAREKLTERFPAILPPLEQYKAKDGTVKVVLPLDGGKTRVETVAIPGDDEEQPEEKGSLTFCLSTQAGCAVGCLFCSTGTQGFTRNLTAEEIVLQVLSLIRLTGRKPTNLVFMGMGEPFFNRAALFGAIDVLTSPRGLALATRRITISTSGVPQGIMDLAGRPGEVNLAVSLHAADNLTRTKLVPLNKKHPLDVLRRVIQEYLTLTSRRVTFEIVLLKDINDGPENAHNLIEFCQGLLCHVNLLRFNPFPGSQFKPASEESEKEFRKLLKKAGIPVTVRRSRGGEILAACGQLAGAEGPKKD